MSGSLLVPSNILGSSGYVLGTVSIDEAFHSALLSALSSNLTIPFYSQQTLQGDIKNLLFHGILLDTEIKKIKELLALIASRKSELDRAAHTLASCLARDIRPFPPLPLDIAQHIVEMAAQSDKRTAVNLSLVSKTIQPWADKFLLHSIFVCKAQQAESFFASVNGTPCERYIKHLTNFGVSPTIPSQLITSSLFQLPRLERFSYWGQASELALMDIPHCSSLKRLSCDPRIFDSADRPDSMPRLSQPNFDLPVFQYVTHFDIITLPSEHSFWDWSKLRNLPCLTHLLMEGVSSQDGITSLVEGPLANLPPSTEIVILQFSYEISENVLYNQVRTGEINEKAVVSTMGRASLDWVLEVDFGTEEEWFGPGGEADRVWKNGLDVIQQRREKRCHSSSPQTPCR